MVRTQLDIRPPWMAEVQILQERKSACLRGHSRHPACRSTCASMHIVQPDRNATGIPIRDTGFTHSVTPSALIGGGII
jgi:hypothetical protein